MNFDSEILKNSNYEKNNSTSRFSRFYTGVKL
jgi:hypothetical protein